MARKDDSLNPKAPLNRVDISKLSTEGLVMIICFLPPYFNQPEGRLISGAEQELARRGVLKSHDDGIEWLLDEDTREELVDCWYASQNLDRFSDIVDLDDVL
jgi:hypothetical protein